MPAVQKRFESPEEPFSCPCVCGQTTANKAVSLVTEGPAHLLSDASRLFIFFKTLRAAVGYTSFRVLIWSHGDLFTYPITAMRSVCKVCSVANTIHLPKPSYNIRREIALVQVPRNWFAHSLSLISIWLEKVTLFNHTYCLLRVQQGMRSLIICLLLNITIPREQAPKFKHVSGTKLFVTPSHT